MKQLVFTLFFICAIVFVHANSYTLIDEGDEEPIGFFEVEVQINEGWNLISGFPSQMKDSSNIQLGDLDYIFGLVDGDYELVYSQDYNNENYFTTENDFVNGDGSCKGEERKSIDSWSYLDCKSSLSKEIINAIKLEQENVVIAENEHVSIKLGDSEYEIYWASTSDSNDKWCTNARENNHDCFFLKYQNKKYDFFNQIPIKNSPSDGNPNNDGFIESKKLDDFSVQFFADYSDEEGKYSFSFYKLDSDKLDAKTDMRVPSYQAKIVNQPHWIYSSKSGSLIFENTYLKPKFISLNRGWNLMSVSPYLSSEKAIWNDCIVEKVYYWDSINQEWEQITAVNEFMKHASEATGLGTVVKTTNGCSLDMKSESNLAPPTLPN